MGLGSLSQAAELRSCEHPEREAAFYLVIDYILEGMIVQERGRFCQRCGVKFAMSVPAEADEITVKIICWTEPGLVVTLSPADPPESKAGSEAA